VIIKMPRINVYKAKPTKLSYIKQTYYIGGLGVVVYKSGHVLVTYPMLHNKKAALNLKPGTKEALFFKRMVREK